MFSDSINDSAVIMSRFAANFPVILGSLYCVLSPSPSSVEWGNDRCDGALLWCSSWGG